MENKIKEIISKLPKPKNKIQILVIIGIIGVILILLSEVIPTSSQSSNDNNEINYDDYIEQLEVKTNDILCSIDGVGKCKVMITLNQTDENVYAKNTDESTGDSSFSNKSEYVLYEDNNNDTPILIKQYFPKVNGVAVVCEGGDDIVVQEKVISAISSLYGISTTKISISKLR